MFGVKEIGASELAEWMAGDSKIRLIDVRSAQEVQQGIIEGGEFIPMHLIPVRATEFKDGGKFVFYCRSGARSAQVCAFLQQQGVEEVYNLSQGIIGWASAGYSLVNSDSAQVGGLAGFR